MSKKFKILIGILAIGVVLVSGWWIWNFYYRCSVEHSWLCKKNCITDTDCVPTCGCGCINIEEKCAGQCMWDYVPYSCKCINNTCEKEKPITSTGNKTETEHFFINSYDANIDIENIKKLSEEAYSVIAKDIGDPQFIGGNKVKVYIYQTQDEYHKATGRPSWSQGVNEYETLSIHLIKGTNFNQIIPHEMTHLLFKDQFPDNWYYIPDWIHEGIAFYEEEKFDDSYIKSRLLPQLEIIKKGNYLSYNELLEKAPSKTGEKNYLWYAQSLSMAKYLINEYGIDRFLELSGNLAEEESIDEALWKSYKNTKITEKMDTQALNEILIERWFEYIKNRNNL